MLPHAEYEYRMTKHALESDRVNRAGWKYEGLPPHEFVVRRVARRLLRGRVERP